MIGFARNAIIIGAIAYFSPVHDETPRQRMEALRRGPQDVLQSVITGGPDLSVPRLALQTVSAMDPQSREALTRKIAELAR